jgi:hypothetical protein
MHFFATLRNNIDNQCGIEIFQQLTEIKYIFVSQDYENFAESTKWKLAPTLACSEYLFGQAKVEKASIKCF